MLSNVALYIVAAWVVIQVADLAIDAGVIHLPLRGVFVAAFLGFPVALVLSWFYDVTRRGFVRTPPVGADTSQGYTEAALASLKQAIDLGWRGAWWFYLGHDFSLESIRDEPQYQTMVEEIESDMAAQLERVRAMEANGELEHIPDIGFDPTPSDDLRQ